MSRAPLGRRAYLRALGTYAPAAEELALGREAAPHPRRLRAWVGASLYHRVYRLIPDGVRTGARVLDLGAWPGTFLRLCRHVFWPGMPLTLAGAGLDYDGTEAPAPGAGGLPSFRDALAADDVAFLALDLDGCAAGGDALPDVERFDVITCMEVIEHLHTPYRLAWLMARLLKPGGVAVLETNNVAYLAGLPRLFVGGSNLDWMLAEYAGPTPAGHERHAHVRFYSMAELGHLMGVHGLTVERREWFYWMAPDEPAWKRLSKRVLQGCCPRLGPYIALKARKPG